MVPIFIYCFSQNGFYRLKLVYNRIRYGKYEFYAEVGNERQSYNGPVSLTGKNHSYVSGNASKYLPIGCWVT